MIAAKEAQMTKPVCAVVGIGPQNGASFARRFAFDLLDCRRGAVF